MIEDIFFMAFAKGILLTGLAGLFGWVFGYTIRLFKIISN